MVSRSEILKRLPPVMARRNVIADDQDTKDIIREVVDAHNYFAKDYDAICSLFDEPTHAETYAALFDFCKKNIRYVIEKNQLQTTRSPAALIGMGNGDCKHYAGFIGGVLDALKRKGRNYTWCYRFASYDRFDPTPQHVFVVAFDRGRETWIDPVLSSLNKRFPIYFFHVDKRVPMLQRISGVNNLSTIGASFSGGIIVDASTKLPLPGVAVWAMGTDRVTLTDSNGAWNLDVSGAAEIYAYKTGYAIMRAATSVVINGYRWFVSPIWAGINAARADEFGSGLYYSRLIFGMDITEPPFTCTVDGDPYLLPPPAWFSRAGSSGAQARIMPQGFAIQYPATYQGQAIRSDMLRPHVNDDHTVTLVDGTGNPFNFKGLTGDQTIAILVANNNFLLKVLACVCGSLQLTCEPFPDCYNVQREYENIIKYRNINMARARQTPTALQYVGSALADAVQAIGKGFIKFIGVIPRTAFLQLLRLNVKGMATHLWENMQDPAKASGIQKKWEGFGGEYHILQNAARDGSPKKALGGIGVTGADDAAVATAIAAAAPLIALLAQWLKSQNNPALNSLVDEGIDKMNKLLVAAGEDPIAVSTAMGGKPVEVTTPGGGTVTIPPTTYQKGGLITWVEDNPAIAAAGGAVVALGAYSLIKKRRAARSRQAYR